MCNLCAMLAALFFVLSSLGQIVAQSPASITLVNAGHQLDRRTGDVLSPAAVLIEGGKIKDGSPTQVQAHAPAGAASLPGLMDSHTHLLLVVILPPRPRKCWAGRTVWARLRPGNLPISSRLLEIRSRVDPSWSGFAWQ